MMDRKKFLKMGGLGLGVVNIPGLKWPFGSKTDFQNANINIDGLKDLDVLGEITLKKPTEIAVSPFGIGCETLDRKLWNPDKVYPWLTDLPVKWARLQTGWARVEKKRGKYDWGWLDESINGLLKRDIQPWLNVTYGNSLYSQGGARYQPMGSATCFAAWKRFVAALADRYQDKVKHYEVWNEPNLGGFWRPDDPNPEKYVKLVKETAPLIKKNCQRAQIIGGATSRVPYNFIRRMLEAGLAEYIDVFSFHPYGTIPEHYIQLIKSLRVLLDEYKPGIDLWQGENGFPSDPGSSGSTGQGPWTENIQAKIMLRRLLTDCALGVKKDSWFLIIDLHDYPKGSGNVNYKGILRAKPKIHPKTAYHALQNLGSVIFGEIEPRNAVVHLLDGNQVLVEEREKSYLDGAWNSVSGVFRQAFNTTNGPVLAYWSMKKAKDQKSSMPVHLFFNDWEGDGFSDPVLVDPLAGNVLGIPSVKSTSGFARNKAQVFQQLPVVDYPLLIMERKKVLKT